ncbi:MAG: hypothetical protein ACI9YB_002285 [Halioglobus sp.]|jgi:hypothetical protein
MSGNVVDRGPGRVPERNNSFERKENSFSMSGRKFTSCPSSLLVPECLSGIFTQSTVFLLESVDTPGSEGKSRKATIIGSGSELEQKDQNIEELSSRVFSSSPDREPLRLSQMGSPYSDISTSVSTTSIGEVSGSPLSSPPLSDSPKRRAFGLSVIIPSELPPRNLGVLTVITSDSPLGIRASPLTVITSESSDGDIENLGEVSTLESLNKLNMSSTYRPTYGRIKQRVYERAFSSCNSAKIADVVDGKENMDSDEFLLQQIKKFPAWASIQDNAEITLEHIGSGASGANYVNVNGVHAAVLKSATKMPRAVMRGLGEELKNVLKEVEYEGLSVEELNDCVDEAIDKVLDSDNAGMVRYVPFYGMAAREELASIIGSELFNVPETLTIFDERHGLCSLQEFSEGAVSLTRSLRSESSHEILNNLDSQSFQDLAVLDILISNYDRHHLNVLFRPETNGDETKYHMVPIDHGGTIPSKVYRQQTKFFWEHRIDSTIELTDTTRNKMKSLNFDSMREKIFKKMGNLGETRILDHLQVMTSFLNACGTSGSKEWTSQDLLGAMSKLENKLWNSVSASHEDCGIVDNLRVYAKEKGMSFDEACRKVVEESVDEYIIYRPEVER